MNASWMAVTLLQTVEKNPAKGGGGGAAPTGGLPGCAEGGTSSLVMLGLMFVLFYFLLIRPQQKRAKEHAALLGGIKSGDKVYTNGGLVGTVTGTDDRFVTLEISEKVRVKIIKAQIGGTLAGIEATAGKDKK